MAECCTSKSMASSSHATTIFTPSDEKLIVRTSLFYNADTLDEIRKEDSRDNGVWGSGKLEFTDLQSKFNAVMKHRLGQMGVCVGALDLAEKTGASTEMLDLLKKVAKTYTDQDMADILHMGTEKEVFYQYDAEGGKPATGGLNSWSKLLDKWETKTFSPSLKTQFLHQYKKNFYPLLVIHLRIQLVTLLLDMRDNLLPCMDAKFSTDNFKAFALLLPTIQTHRFSRSTDKSTDLKQIDDFLKSVQHLIKFEFTQDLQTQIVCTNVFRLWERHIGFSSKFSGGQELVHGNSEAENLLINVLRNSNIEKMLIPYAYCTMVNKDKIYKKFARSTPAGDKNGILYYTFGIPCERSKVIALFDATPNDTDTQDDSLKFLSASIKSVISGIDHIILRPMSSSVSTKLKVKETDYFHVKLFFADSGYSDTYLFLVTLDKKATNTLSCIFCEGVDQKGKTVELKALLTEVVKNTP